MLLDKENTAGTRKLTRVMVGIPNATPRRQLLGGGNTMVNSRPVEDDIVVLIDFGKKTVQSPVVLSTTDGAQIQGARVTIRHKNKGVFRCNSELMAVHSVRLYTVLSQRHQIPGHSLNTHESRVIDRLDILIG